MCVLYRLTSKYVKTKFTTKLIRKVRKNIIHKNANSVAKSVCMKSYGEVKELFAEIIDNTETRVKATDNIKAKMGKM